MRLLLERSWSMPAGEISLLRAIGIGHVEIVTALMHNMRRVGSTAFESALSQVAKQGSVEVLRALVTNVASTKATFDRCMSRAVTSAFQEEQVRTDLPTSLVQKACYVSI